MQYRSTNHDAFHYEVKFSFGLCCFALVPSVMFSAIASITTDSRYKCISVCLSCLSLDRKLEHTVIWADGSRGYVSFVHGSLGVFTGNVSLQICSLRIFNELCKVTGQNTYLLSCVVRIVTAEHCKCRLMLSAL